MARVASLKKMPVTLEVQGTELLDRAKTVTAITTRDQYEAAVELVKDLKRMQKAVFDHHEPMRIKAQETKDAVLAARDKLLKPLERAERFIKGLGGVFLNAEELARKQEEARLLGERRRQEEEARLAQAGALEDAGEHEAAAAVISHPINVAPAVLERPKVDGVSTPRRWKYRITNMDLIPDVWWSLDEKRLGEYVRSVGDQASIPGIEVYEELGMAVRA
jgi:hypothetical protein